MSVTYSQIGYPGHTFSFQSMNYNYNSGRYGEDRTNHQYRLPPPHSPIPIGLNVDNSHRGEQQARPHERTSLASPSRNDQQQLRREQLPSVHQLLSERSASYLPPPLPPPPPQTGHLQGHGLQSSPSIHPRSPDSHLNPSCKVEGVTSNYAPLPPSRGSEYEPYRTPQPNRLPSISQVGIEPSSHVRASGNSRGRLALDEDSPRSQFSPSDFTTSPTQSVSASSHLLSVARQQDGAFQVGPQGPAASNQVVDERYLPGKGVCYIFADNSYCPKLIDGQPVNPNWGLTKAGKARKRLAQACIPCREKKVKCQPNLPKCDQCQKSGRECRFESAPRATRGRSSSYDPQSV